MYYLLPITHSFIAYCLLLLLLIGITIIIFITLLLVLLLLLCIMIHYSLGLFSVFSVFIIRHVFVFSIQYCYLAFSM